MHRGFITATVIACGLTAACSSSGGSGGHSSSAASGKSSAAGVTAGSAQAQRITVHTTDMLRFQPSVIDARVGTVRIALVNDGSYPHNLDVSANHTTSATVTGDPGQQRTTLTLHFTKPGTYSFECTYHSSAGMTGRIVVRG